MPFLLIEENAISLRTATVFDTGNRVLFRLRPTDLSQLTLTHRKWTPKDLERLDEDAVWLFRHMRSEKDENQLAASFPCADQDIRPLRFENPPSFRLVWAESGHSVAVYLNDEPWAFIDEQTRKGYSKGILGVTSPETRSGELWNQSLFEKLFS